MPRNRIHIKCAAGCGWKGQRNAATGQCLQCGAGVVARAARAPMARKGRRVRLVVSVAPETAECLSAHAEAVGALSGSTVGGVALDAAVASGRLNELTEGLKRP